MAPKCDSIGGFKITPGLWTIVFRLFVVICSLCGTLVIASYWVITDEHNDKRYVKLADDKLRWEHHAAIHNLQLENIHKDIAEIKELLKRQNK